MTSTDRNPKRCRTSTGLPQSCCVDRLTILPDDLLGHILSMLPTKDVAATLVLSKRMSRAFGWISSIDLDDSPISHCVKRPHLVERFSLFESFIDNVLHKLSQSRQALTRFRLRLGGDITIDFDFPDHKDTCPEDCLPNLEPARLYAWISYPLTHCGLKELDLTFHVGNPDEYDLPPGIFTRRSLEVLRLDLNLEINGGAEEIPVICLPNLKLLHLRSFVFTQDDVVTRLVSNCPVLEDLTVRNCWWVKADRLNISSHSLLRLNLVIRRFDREDNFELVVIDTPNLQYLSYSDNLAYSYSITHMNALVETSIDIVYLVAYETSETCFEISLNLARPLSNVQYLELSRYAIEILHFAGELKDQLPIFHKLRTLTISALYRYERWDVILLLILHSSPLLETLIFPQGFLIDMDGPYDFADLEYLEAGNLEAEGWRTTEIMPSCCQSHLKRIEINDFYGFDRELNMIKFLPCHASVLKEFVVCLLKDDGPYSEVQYDVSNFDELLKALPRASNTCSIIVH